MQIPDYSIRSAQPDDLLRLIDLLKITDLYWELGDREEVFRKKLAHDPDSIIVLEHRGAVIGAVVTIYDPWVSLMWHLTIDPAWQGKGLGNLLAEEAEKRLAARGTTCICGYIVPTNVRSLALFKKRGFTQSSVQVIPVDKPTGL